jgi:hypothetical protein
MAGAYPSNDPVGIKNLTGKAQCCADLLGQWRKVVVERAPELFAAPKGARGEDVRIAELERLVGQ